MKLYKIMEGGTRKHRNSYFSKIHERIQVKYEEMQRKLERSKSMDALHVQSNISENSLYSMHNVSDFTINQYSEKSITTVKIVNDDSTINHAGFNEIHDDDISIFSFTNSIESLTEDQSYNSSPQPPPRVRLRDRIAAVRERNRRKKEEEKKEKEIRKKLESPDISDGFILSNTFKAARLSKRDRTASVTVALINIKEASNDDKNRNIYFKVRLGLEKYKSKLVKYDSSEVNLLELINLSMYDEHMLEITLWSKEKQDSFIGIKVIDLYEIIKEETQKMTIVFESEFDKWELLALVTVSGTYSGDVMEHSYFDTNFDSQNKKMAWCHLADDYSDVGYLSVLVHGARGLSAQDTFCVFEFGNNRLQSHTEYKTTDPKWMRIFNCTVTDVTSTFELSICDESKKSEVIGKISIPLLNINNGELKWYALKDKYLRDRAKGSNPRLLLEMKLNWHPIKAAIRVINVKENIFLKTEPKFDRHLFVRNVIRCKFLVAWILEAIRWIKTCFEWESRKWSFIALLIWLLVCWFFEVWMLPLLLLIPFIWYRPQKYRFEGEKYIYDHIAKELREDDIEVKIAVKEDKKSLKEHLATLQEITQTVQNLIGNVASIGESIKNLVNFTVPYLSFLAILIILTITLVIYLIPVKYLFMAWGINKFTRKIRNPNRIPNNEILDLLSRVPDDESLLDWEELPLNNVEDIN